MANGVQDRLVYVYNQTRETFVATEVTVANNYLLRLVGLLGKTERWAQPGRGLWIIPCRGVHTLGMMFPLDLVFLNKEKQVIHVEEYVRPFRISKVFRKAASVLEFPVHTIYRSGTREGDCLEIAWLRNERTENNPIVPRRVEFQSKRDLCEVSKLATKGSREQENSERIA
jgi:uncharacterized membrane protein (UPF0127 family)